FERRQIVLLADRRRSADRKAEALRHACALHPNRDGSHRRDSHPLPGHLEEPSMILVSLSTGTFATICVSPDGHRTSTLSMVVAAPRPKCSRMDPWPAKLLPPSTNRSCVRPPAVTLT